MQPGGATADSQSADHTTAGREQRLWCVCDNYLCISCSLDDITGIFLDGKKMRSHLAKYFIRERCSHSKGRGIAPSSCTHESQRISVCTAVVSCQRPGLTWSHVISCDQWSTCMCVGLKVMPASEEQWICNDCA